MNWWKAESAPREPDLDEQTRRRLDEEFAREHAEIEDPDGPTAAELEELARVFGPPSYGEEEEDGSC